MRRFPLIPIRSGEKGNEMWSSKILYLDDSDGGNGQVLALIGAAIAWAFALLTTWAARGHFAREELGFGETVLSWPSLFVVVAFVFAGVFTYLFFSVEVRKARRQRDAERQTNLHVDAARVRGQFPFERQEHPSIPDLFPATEFAVMLRGRMHVRRIAAQLRDFGFPFGAIARALHDIGFGNNEIKVQLEDLGLDDGDADTIMSLTDFEGPGHVTTKIHSVRKPVQIQDARLVELFRGADMDPEHVARFLKDTEITSESVAFILSQLGVEPDKVSEILEEAGFLSAG
jgi:hypothetical protein